ncbi:MAG: phosphoethanolamine transferase, partial [Bacteroidales bacterium]
LYISNQALNRSLIDFYAAEADQRIDLSPVNNDLYKENLPDGNALSIIQNAIDEDDSDLFIVFHSYGSHFNYQHRYPKDMATFKPDNASTINHKNRQNVENAYDNSIRYTDYVLNSAINVLNDTSLCSGMLYLSDHGEDLMDDDRRKFLHASPIPTYYQLHIPVILWFSENYILANPVKRNAAINNYHKPVSTSATFNTITDMAGISTILSDTSYSLLNPAFEVRERLYVNDHNEPCLFFNLGLDQIDLNLIDSMKLYYNHSLYQKPVY